MDVDVSDEELKTMLTLEEEMRSMRMKTRRKMKSNVESSDLGRQRYMEIRRARRSGDEPAMSEEEEKQLEKLEAKNKKAQENMKKKLKKKVEASDMEWKRFQKINEAVRKDRDTQKRYRKLKQEEKQKGGEIKRKRSEPSKKKQPKKAPSDDDG